VKNRFLILASSLSENLKVRHYLRAFWHAFKTFRYYQGLPSETKSIKKTKKSRSKKFFWKKSVAKFGRNSNDFKFESIQFDDAIRNELVEIIIPVYNRFDLVENLLDQLKKQIDSIADFPKTDFLVTCADDFSSNRTSKWLAEKCSQLNFQYSCNTKNLGFIGNVNAAWVRSRADYVILLNSDVIICDNFLKTALSPLRADSRIALSTNPTFDQIAHKVPDGLNLLLLNQFLDKTAQGRATFVDACTAVGYSLTINRKLVQDLDLFDASFGKGYGEDSDLHYRILKAGFRSVWNLESIVGHVGGASFDSIDSVSEQRLQGKNLFFARWGVDYFQDIEAATEILEKGLTARFAGFAYSGKTKNWVITPAISKPIGGLMVAEQLACDLMFQEKNTVVIALSNVDELVMQGIAKPASISFFLKHRKKNDKVFFVGAQGLDFVKEKIISLTGEETYFNQGPDWLIDPSVLPVYVDVLPRIKNILSVSKYMEDQMTFFGNFDSMSRYEPKTKHAFFSGLELTTKIYDFVFVYRQEHGKAPEISIALANLLSTHHKVLFVCSERPYGLSKKANVDTNRARSNVLKVLAKSRVLIDMSLFEGFGLVTREAALVNTFVLMNSNNSGTQSLVEFQNHFATFDNYSNLFDLKLIAESKLSNALCPGCEFCNNQTTSQ
jgi:GT2 family glycosyltransferase